MPTDPSLLEKTEIVLVVDDDAEIREALYAALRFEGYKVHTAMNGMEAIDTARVLKPDLILMDLRMPKMDGFEAIKVIRSEDDTKEIPIIAISAWASAKHKERALAAGANEHFTKPVDLNRLLTTIGRYLK